jgi:hypothetical protein
MAKKNINKATKRLATEETAKRPTASAGLPLQRLTEVTPINLSEKAAVVAEAPMLSEAEDRKVTFVFPPCPCCAERVSLSGDFNGWSPDATPMKRHQDGHWEATIELAPGRYEYKFVRDGEWLPDLLARENVLNGYGTLNSVIEVRRDNR